MKFSLILFSLILSTSIYADTLSLYFIKSPYGINWTSPWLMTTSTLKNQIAFTKSSSSKHSISHTYAEITCDSTGVHLLRGMTSEGNTEERELLFKKKYGLGVMFHTYRGKLEKNDDLLKDLNDYYGSSRMSKLEISISPETCARLVRYAYEYEELGYGKMYSGLQSDPLKGEGAGCSAFAVSFLRVGGLMLPFTEKWKDKIDVPLKLIGGPMTNNKVSLFKLLTSVKSKWSNKVPHYHLEAWNPEKMHKWLKKTHNEVASGSYSAYDAEIAEFQNSKILKLNLESLPVPDGPIWEIRGDNF